MATVREYFDTDARVFTVHKPWLFGDPDRPPLFEVIAKIAYDFEANAKYWYFYVPEHDDLSSILASLVAAPEFSAAQLGPDGDGLAMHVGIGDYSDRQSTDTLQFTRRAHFYLDFEVSEKNRASLVAEMASRGFFATIRDREYARVRSALQKPLAFISHDSRDKDSFVRELAHELTKNICPVWFDEYSLSVGDPLRASIERGLKTASKCVIVLSPNFLANKGWGLAEFDSIFTREIMEKTNVILPVWLNVDAMDVYKFSPRLADKVGVSAQLGVTEVARRLAQVIKGNPTIGMGGDADAGWLAAT